MSVHEALPSSALLDAELWDALCGLGHQADFASGETLLFEGSASESMLVLEAGLAAVSVADPAGDEVFLAFRGPGSLLGEFGYLDRRPRSAMVRAVAATRCRVLPRPVLDRFLAADPRAGQALSAAVVAKMRAVTDRRVRYAQGRIGTRIGRVLLDHADEFGTPGQGDDVVIEVPLSQGRIADLVGAGTRIVGLELARLQEAGLVDTGYRSRPRRLRVLDPVALAVRVDGAA
ncbi:Crp/Fnr family transcriptional regulator [Pseudonocardia oroxyli]|uniref:cAMP-binding domain of CRP or a regulatory subunit of cAMP-dependent protein kinases n=1 Tax=Pseudonocardia oroxyli TaxID=366584 RepID=A0A1G7XL16_PSEOR|nr:Crp/Fnr family transcriptional regulator [Pseudonocardia oroxyli]SDG84751.1 cAMP-binding domain of CRP or a regulatory subunit of cAMP-dependent protein kinases [Pseudonocardia oroxyli]